MLSNLEEDLSYFGDTLAHSALLGVTLAYAFSLNIAFSVFVISCCYCSTSSQPYKKEQD